MEFYRIGREKVRAMSENCGNYYEFKLGNPISVTSLKKENRNGLLSSVLSTDNIEDKFMLRYTPYNVIRFDADIVNSDSDCIDISFGVDKDEKCLRIGGRAKYEIDKGVLMFSSILSANNKFVANRSVYISKRYTKEYVGQKVKVLGVGLRDDKLFGLFLVTKARGVAVSDDLSQDLSYSVTTWKLTDNSNWDKYEIDDFFKGSKIVEL